MTARVAYAWQTDDGKWHLSALPASIKSRPFNTYDDEQSMVEEAGQRGLDVVRE